MFLFQQIWKNRQNIVVFVLGCLWPKRDLQYSAAAHSVYVSRIISRDDNGAADLFQTGKDATNSGQLDGHVAANFASFVRDKVVGAADVFERDSRLREHADAIAARRTHLEQSAGCDNVRRRLYNLLHSIHHSDQCLSATNGSGKPLIK